MKILSTASWTHFENKYSYNGRSPPQAVMGSRLVQFALDAGLSLSLNGDELFFRKLLFGLLGNAEAQHTMLQFRGDIFLRKRFTHVEAPLKRSVITLLAYGPAFLLLVLFDRFRGRNGQMETLD